LRKKKSKFWRCCEKTSKLEVNTIFRRFASQERQPNFLLVQHYHSLIATASRASCCSLLSFQDVVVHVVVLAPDHSDADVAEPAAAVILAALDERLVLLGISELATRRIGPALPLEVRAPVLAVGIPVFIINYLLLNFINN
jgi:hypothetical protein